MPGGKVARERLPSAWLSYAVAGVAGAIALGLIAGSDVMALIPGLYGLEVSVDARAPIGWGLHLVHGGLFAVGFAAFLDTEALGGYRGSPIALTGLGVGYAGLLWVLGWSIVGPALLATMTGFGSVSDVPVWDLAGLAGHIVYGLAIGPARAAITNVPRDEAGAGA